MQVLEIPKVITKGRATNLAHKLLEERREICSKIAEYNSARSINQRNGKQLVQRWLRQPSEVLEFYVIEPADCPDFRTRLSGLIGGNQNFAFYRRWRGATQYLVPLSYEFVIKLMSEPQRAKSINNRKFVGHRLNCVERGQKLPWESDENAMIVENMIALVQ